MAPLRSLLGSIVSIILLSGCMQTRYITEQYIKNEIEEHTPGQFSTIRTYSIYKSMQTSASSRYVELTGYKYNGRKGLVIGVDRYYRTTARMTGLPVDMATYTYINLSEAEARAMHDNIAVIQAELKAEKKVPTGEELYRDYTVNEDVFISARRTATSNGSAYLHLWVKGEKYTLPATTLPKKLKKFLNY